jgi:hypothetical protein
MQSITATFMIALQVSLVAATLQFYNQPKFLTLPELLLPIDLYVVPQAGLQDPNYASLSLADASGKQLLIQNDGTKAFTEDYPLKYTQIGASDIYKYKYVRANWTGLIEAGEYTLTLAYTQTKLSDQSKVPVVQSTKISIVAPAVKNPDVSLPVTKEQWMGKIWIPQRKLRTAVITPQLRLPKVKRKLAKLKTPRRKIFLHPQEYALC